METEVQPGDDKLEIILNKEIDKVNKKVVSWSLRGAIVAGIVVSFFCPFPGIFPWVLWTVIISYNVFLFLYRLFFHRFGKELVADAKKRGKYITDKWLDDDSSSMDDDFISTNIRYHNHSSNIYYDNR